MTASTQYQPYHGRRETTVGNLGRTLFRGGGVMVIVIGAAFIAEWTMPEGKKPMQAIVTTLAALGTIDDAAEAQSAVISAQLQGAVNRRSALADQLMRKEASLKEGKADWNVKCDTVDWFLGGLCGAYVDQTYDPSIKEIQREYASVEDEIAEIQQAVAGIPASTNAWQRGRGVSFSFEQRSE